jgi:hypothetical protein
VSKDSDQTETAPRKFKLGPLGNLNQVTKGLAKTIRAMAGGTLDSQVGARICNGLGIMRACRDRAVNQGLNDAKKDIERWGRLRRPSRRGFQACGRTRRPQSPRAAEIGCDQVEGRAVRAD